MIPHVQENRDDVDEREYIYESDKYKKDKKWFDWLLLNKPLRAIIIFLLVTVVAPLLIYHFLFHSTHTREGSCLIRRDARLPCGLGDIPEAECSSECCYDHTNRFCFHVFPSRFTYVLNQTWNEEVLLSPRLSTVPFGSQRSLDRVRISVDEVSATHLSLNFYKSDEQIFGRRIKEKNYTYDILGDNLNVVVNATQGNIFNTAHGTFIAADDIWELTFRITNENMFGLGEIPLLPNTVKVIYNHRGGMSSIPLIYAKLNDCYHGLLIDTMTPTEIIIRGENQLVIRSITKTGLKFHLFVGPKPSDIMKDVMSLAGKKKNFEYWMLGPHFCSDRTTLDELRTFISTAQQQMMPFESHCGVAQPYFSSECNSTHVQLVNDGASALRNQNRKFIPHVSPYIRYSKPEVPDKEETTTESSSEKYQIMLSKSAQRCFNDEEFEQYIIRDPDAENVYIGLVEDQDVIYPKYDNISEKFMKKLWIYDDVDGVVLKNNWPLDESEKSVNKTRLFLPYFNENFERAFQYTPPWNATRPERYLYTHNDYGNQFATAFNMVKKNIPIISASQWIYGNVVLNRQNIETSWASFHRELIEGSLAGISGNWYWSSPICGDTENINISTQNRLCAKWYMASTYFPMVQINSKEVRRDPLAFTGTDRTHMIRALTTRTSIMSYLYSVLQEGPLLRPMFYQYPSVEELTTVTTQFSVGDDLLIVPNLLAQQTHVRVRVPPGKWFEFGSGLKLEGDIGQTVTMTTTEADFLTFVRGGSIMIQQTDIGTTVADTQLAPFTLLVVLDCEANSTKCFAKGKFYMAPDMAILFEADQTTVYATAEGDNFDVFCGWSDKLMWGEDIWYIRVYGLDNDKNNNDHHFMGEVFIRLCDIKFMGKIIYKYM